MKTVRVREQLKKFKEEEKNNSSNQYTLSMVSSQSEKSGFNFFFVDLMSALHSELCNADITQSGTYCAVPDWWCSGSFSPSCFVLSGFCLPLFFFDNRPLPRTRGSVILCRNYGARAWLSAKLPKLRREDEANCEVTLIGPKIEVPW